ncbi:SDR family oxidoreductase [Roseomonas sp. HJA6]|uniref:SDR family oxidoreductase n=1 Tax=Roseomonas alba TaxID=2846776 RepID=A0ABS7A9L1_9PROT|nr:SDR family oxidoreductase [Neoroseomonas alba]MBW6398961.1 SDR family oxidoreductase [Neoroseomonas alba]
MAATGLLVAGASGAAASRMMDAALADPYWRVTGLSRRRPDGAGDWIEADLTDPDGLRRALAARPDITHLLYASRAPHGETGIEDIPANVAMLRNLLDAAEAVLPGFAHLHMIQGGKWYGMHLGPFPVPAREDDPRPAQAGFYHAQQDLVAARQAGRAWSWSASRPNFVMDVAPGRARNMVSTLGAYAAICREAGLPFDFPGSVAAWEAPQQVTEAGLLADAVLWMMRDPRCANRAFNVTNGDAMRWPEVWALLAARFGLAAGGPSDASMRVLMAGREAVWDTLRARHGLTLPLDRVASWDFADFFLGLGYEVQFAMDAARMAGFTKALDSLTMIDRHIAGYRAARVLPGEATR